MADYFAFAVANARREFPAPVPVRPLRMICSWCPDATEQTRQAQDAGESVTHGMCPACFATMEDR